MTHKIISFLSILLLSLPLVACSTDDSEVKTPIYPDNGEENPSSDDVAMISFTHAVPDGYEQEAEKKRQDSPHRLCHTGLCRRHWCETYQYGIRLSALWI